MQTLQNLFLVFSLKENFFGINALGVKEIIKMPEITKVPNSPFGIRGMIKFREQVIPIFDMRLKMGMDSLIDENKNLITELQKREQDHKDYLADLEHSLYNDQPFNKTLNPRECAFGKWYYSYKTENLVIKNTLEEFEQPHNQFHELAKELIGLRNSGQKKLMLEKLNSEKGKRLSVLINLFSELYKQIQTETKELAIIFEVEDRLIGFSVDKVFRILSVESKDIKPLDGNLKNDAFDGLIDFNDKLCVLINNKVFGSEVINLFN